MKSINNEAFFVYTPKPNLGLRNKRFLVSANRLSNYITDNNANKALQAFKNMQTNKTTLKFRKFGKIEIYLK